MKNLLNTGIKAFFAGKKGSEPSGVIYGYLYNWYALTGDVSGNDVISNKDIDGGGWIIPTYAEMIAFRDYLVNTYPEITNSNIGDYLKGTSIEPDAHPRWNFNEESQGNFYDTFGLAYYGGSGRSKTGVFYINPPGEAGYFWTRSDAGAGYAINYEVYRNASMVFNGESERNHAFSSRLFRPIITGEGEFPDGTQMANYIGNDGRTYRTVKVGDYVWLAENLAETKYYSGIDIPVVTDNTEWSNLTTGARCAYGNNEDYV